MHFNEEPIDEFCRNAGVANIGLSVSPSSVAISVSFWGLRGSIRREPGEEMGGGVDAVALFASGAPSILAAGAFRKVSRY